jgi:hypothetical protein
MVSELSKAFEEWLVPDLCEAEVCHNGGKLDALHIPHRVKL